MKRFLSHHGVLWVGLISYAVMYAPMWLRLEYDSSGWAGVLVVAGYVIGTPYRWLYRLLYYAGGERQFAGIQLAVAVLGLLLFVLADIAAIRWVHRRRGGSGTA